MFPVGDGLDVEMVPMSTSFHSGDITHSGSPLILTFEISHLATNITNKARELFI